MMTINPHKRFLELLEDKIAFKLSSVSENIQKYLYKFNSKEKSNSYSACSYYGIRSIEHNRSLHKHGTTKT